MARANDFICGLSGTTGAAKKEPAWHASDSRPMMLDLHGLSPVKRSAMSEATREAEQLRQLARLLNLPPEMLANAYKVFSRHAAAPDATPAAPCPSLLQEGRLSKEQFRKVVHDLLDRVPGDTADVLVNEAFRDADKDGSNEIDFGEYAIWISSRSFSEVLNLTAEQIDMRDLARKHGMTHAQVEQYKKSFDDFDTDGSGVINRDEFEAILSKCARLPQGTALPQQKVQTLWRLADSDGSHELDFQEFLVFYKRYFDGNGFENMYRFRRRPPNV
jgi:Ca2+-binding EF-hand superfamily protein